MAAGGLVQGPVAPVQAPRATERLPVAVGAGADRPRRPRARRHPCPAPWAGAPDRIEGQNPDSG